MLNRAELKEIASANGQGYFVSLYLNVDPAFNKKGDHLVHFKNMMKNTIDSLDKAVYKKVKPDLEKIDNYVLANKRLFRKGLVILSSTESSFWKEFHLGVPVRHELVIDKTPYTKPLFDIMDTYPRYAVLLVDRESARIFIIHLGEIIEFGEIFTAGIPGKHKKGGWSALAQSKYERHTDYHISMHLRDVLDKLDSFLSGEYIGRLIIGGADETVALVKGMLHKTVLNKVIGTIKIDKFAKNDEVLNKVGPVLSAFERIKEEETVEELITLSMKNENAVLGIDNVIHALQEQRVMTLILLKDYQGKGHVCPSCGFLTAQSVQSCPYCKGITEPVDYIIDLAAEKAIRQGAAVEVVSVSKKLKDAGGIGAFLRF
jgi:peptide chain release factor subunit 1